MIALRCDLRSLFLHVDQPLVLTKLRKKKFKKKNRELKEIIFYYFQINKEKAARDFYWWSEEKVLVDWIRCIILL